MSTGQKVALAVLVLLALCFVVAVMLPSRAGQDTGSAEDSAKVFRNLALAPAAVDQSELSAGCFQGDRLKFTGDCTLTVAPSRQTMRILRLQPDRPVDLEAPAPRIDDFTIEAELKPNKEVPIAIDERGGEIELNCIGLEACTVLVR
jgi:hypothetical protein